jgi:hypothetical protein
MSIQNRFSYSHHPESPASTTSSKETAKSFDKYQTDLKPVRGNRKKVPRLPKLDQTMMYHGTNCHASNDTSSDSPRTLLQNDEVARMRKLKRRLFLEAVAQSAE